MAHELAPLPYAPDALEPWIDTPTLQIHHGKHHATYVTNLNKALDSTPVLQTLSVEDLLENVASAPSDIRQAVINNGGGHYNHTLYWNSMGPNAGGAPGGELGEALASAFGSFDGFKEKITNAGLTRFGSGWAWLVFDQNGRLAVLSTANQDCPVSNGQQPILVVDVWEHAYYLKYQNRRAEYLNAWWNVVNWAAVADRFAKLK